MIRIYPGDIVQVEGKNKYYYAFVLSKIKLFGGNLTYALHLTSNSPILPELLLQNHQPGFHAFIDFIGAKRENRIQRIMEKIDFSEYDNINYFKVAYRLPPDPPFAWSIKDKNFKEIRKVKELSEEEKMYPYAAKIGEEFMIDRIKAKWKPSMTEFTPYKLL